MTYGKGNIFGSVIVFVSWTFRITTLFTYKLRLRYSVFVGDMPTLAAFSARVLGANLNYPDALFHGLVLKEFIEFARNAQEASELTR